MAVGAGAAVGRPDRTAGQPDTAGLRAEAARYITSCAGSTDGWLRLLAAAAASPGAGFTSAILIAAQDAGPAASYDDWKTAGWQVRKGEQAHVWILVGDDGQRPARVFTRSQVRPARAAASPPLPGAAAAAGNPERALGALTTVARRHGYAVTRPAGAARACTDFGEHAITIPAGLGPLPAAAALARELACIIRDEDRPRLDKDRPRPAGESTAGLSGADVIEADSAAWLVLARLGLDPAAAGIRFPAARDWAGGDPRAPLAGLITAAGDRFTAAAAQITAHAGKVLAGLPPAPAPAPAAARSPQGAAGTAAEAGPAYGQYPRRRPSGQATVTHRPAWPCPDQALIQANLAAAAFYRACLAGTWASGYLHDRGFGPQTCRSWQLGYAPPGWTALCDHLRAAGLTGELLEQAGLASKSRHGLIDRFRDRVMIPIRGPHGQLAGFAGRARDGHPDSTPKYLNTCTTAIYHKDELLYGLPEAAAALAAGARPVLVEGYFDAIATTIAGQGQLAGAATGGTTLSVTQVRLLAASCDLSRCPLLVARDPDTAGRRAMLRDYQVLAPYCPAATAPALPGHSDPAAIYQHGGPDALAGALRAGEHPLADVAVDAVLDPFQEDLDKECAVAQVAAMRAAARLLAATRPDDMVRQVIRVAERTRIPHWEVASEFAEAAAAAEPRPKEQGPDRNRAPRRGGREFPARPARAAGHGRERAGPGSAAGAAAPPARSRNPR